MRSNITVYPFINERVNRYIFKITYYVIDIFLHPKYYKSVFLQYTKSMQA